MSLLGQPLCLDLGILIVPAIIGASLIGVGVAMLVRKIIG